MSVSKDGILALIGQRQFQKALDKLPHSSAISEDDILFFQGICYGNTGQLEEAINALEACVALNPAHVQAHHNLGQAWFQQAEWHNAMRQFMKVIELDPENASSYYTLGCIYTQLQQEEKAEESYRQALAIAPEYPQALNNLGSILNKRECFDEAVALFEKALRLQPDANEIHINLGAVYHKLEQLEKAYQHLFFVVQKAPKHYELLNNFGSLLIDMLRNEEAIDTLIKVVELKEDFIPAYYNLGKAYDSMGNEALALQYYRKTLELNPNFRDDTTPFSHCVQNADWNIGFILLRQGDFKQGWRHYEGGLDDPERRRRPDISAPVWSGENLAGKRLLITSEQGVGDEAMFSSCLQRFKHEASSIVLECDERLQPVFLRAFPDIVTLPLSRDAGNFERLEAVQADYAIPLGSLAISLAPEKHRSAPYLRADTVKLEKWKQRFDALGSGMKVGIAWKGGAKRDTQIQRSINPVVFSSLLVIPGIQWINCQYGAHEEERKIMKDSSAVTVHDWEDSDPMQDLDDFFAKLAALDLVISIDNSTVHFAGALGVPTWVLLPYVANWRWTNGSEHTFWYVSLELFRQQKLHDWEAPIGSIKQRLQDKIQQGHASA